MKSFIDINVLNEGIDKVKGFLSLFPLDKIMSEEETRFVGAAVENAVKQSMIK